MAVGRALTLLFRDPRWGRKLGIGVLLAVPAAALWLLNQLVLRDHVVVGGRVASPVLGAVVNLVSLPLFGFELRLVRRVVAGSDLPLPDWSDFGGILRDGFTLWAVVTVWGLPATLAGLVGEALSPGMGGEGPLVLRCLVLLVTLAVFVTQPAAEARLATTGSVAAGLDAGAVFRVVERNLGGYLLLLLLLGVGATVGFGLSIGLVLLAWGAAGGRPGRDAMDVGIALLIFFPYVRFVLAHLYGQACARASGAPASAPSTRSRRKGEPNTGPARRPPPRPAGSLARGRSGGRPVTPPGTDDGRPD